MAPRRASSHCLLAAAGAGARIVVLRQPGVVGIVVRLAHPGVGVDEAAALARHHVVAAAERVAVRQHERLVVEHLAPGLRQSGHPRAATWGRAEALTRGRPTATCGRTPSSSPIHSLQSQLRCARARCPGCSAPAATPGSGVPGPGHRHRRRQRRPPPCAPLLDRARPIGAHVVRPSRGAIRARIVQSQIARSAPYR